MIFTQFRTFNYEAKNIPSKDKGRKGETSHKESHSNVETEMGHFMLLMIKLVITLQTKVFYGHLWSVG